MGYIFLIVLKHIDKYLVLAICRLLKLSKNRNRASENISSLNKDNAKILFIKLWGIGNNVFLLPLIEAVKTSYPNANIYVLTLEQNKGIFKNCQFVKCVYGVNTRNPFALAHSLIRILDDLKKKNLDIIFDFEQFVKISILMAQMLKAKLTVGFDTPNQHRGEFYDIVVPYDKHGHILEHFVQIIKPMGVYINKLKLTPISVSVEDKNRVFDFLAQEFITDKEILVGIHAGSGINFTGRRWPLDSFTRLADKLARLNYTRVIFTGNKKEAALVRKIINNLEDKSRIIDTSGKFNIAELAFLISMCKVFVSNDTAPVHIAAAMGTSVVGLYGPNNPDIYGPYSDNKLVFYKDFPCSPCITNLNAKISFCLHNKCMRDIGVEEVYDGIVNNYLINR